MHCIRMTFSELCAASFVAKVWRGAFLFLTVLKKCFSKSGVFTEEETVEEDRFLVM